MNSKDVNVIAKTTPFKGYFRIDRYRLTHRLFEGGWSGEMTREVFERGHAVTAVLFDADRDCLVMVEQFRIGAYAALAAGVLPADASPWLIENIAGIIEDGEDPAEVARREAREEADCEIQELFPACHYLASPGASSESVQVFCARVDAGQAGGIHGLTEEHENIRVRVVPVAEALQWLDEGRFNNAMTMIGLQWFRLHHVALRARWRKSVK
jgi:ADP-ribose pyrophosphatase